MLDVMVTMTAELVAELVLEELVVVFEPAAAGAASGAVTMFVFAAVCQQPACKMIS